MFPAIAQAADPIKIGLSLSLTGATAPAGRQVRPGSKSGATTSMPAAALLGRPVELVYYDDQANPANVPGIYAKLIDVDKVDLLIGPYGTNVIAAAMPVIIQNKRMTIGIFGLGANKEFKYGKYFSMNSQGASPKNYSWGSSSWPSSINRSRSASRWSAPMSNSPATRSTARARTPRSWLRGRLRAHLPVGHGRIATIVRAMQATNPDIVYAATLPVDTVGIIRASSEVRFPPKLFGGAFLGPLVPGSSSSLGR